MAVYSTIPGYTIFTIETLRQICVAWTLIQIDSIRSSNPNSNVMHLFCS